MAPIVIDSSVVVKWFDAEPYATEAERISIAYEQGTLTLLAPDLLLAEVGNIFGRSKRLRIAGHQRKPRKRLPSCKPSPLR